MDPVSDILKDIKLQLRASMNGPVSQSLREKGLTYKIIFGLEWNRICEIATGLEKNTALAQSLWKEDIRECRLLAGLVQPIDEFDESMANVWIESMRFPEEAQYTVLTLLQYLPMAKDAAFRWLADERNMFQLCGLLTLTRLLMREVHLTPADTEELLDQAECCLRSDTAYIRTAAHNALLKLAMQGNEYEEKRVESIFTKGAK